MYKKILMLFAFHVLAINLVSAQTAEEKSVADRMETLRKAMLASDTNSLRELTADQLSYGHSIGLVEDKAAFVQQFVTGKTQFTSLDFSEQTIRIVNDIAIVRNRLVGNTNNNNVPGKVDIIVLLVWQKQKGKWKLLARQAARIPTDVK